MSAFLVSNHHVNALAAFGAAQGLLTHDFAHEAALDLWLENRASLQHLYSDASTHWPELARLETDFVYETAQVPTWHILKAAICYMHQSCEHPGWQRSRAHALATRIEARARKLLNLPAYGSVSRHHGYIDAPWALEAPATADRLLHALARSVAALNPAAGEIGAGRLAQLVEDAQRALAAVEQEAR